MKNRYEIKGDITEVYFKNCSGHFTIDTWVLELFLSLDNTWHKDKNGYVKTSLRAKNGTRKNVTVHRLLMGFPDGKVVDHIDRNRLNNTFANFRAITSSQNLQNTGVSKSSRTGYRNVHLDRTLSMYQVIVGGEYFGHYEDIMEANEVAIEARRVMYPYSID